MTTPLYPKLAAKGAAFGARAGWERAVWFAPNGVAPVSEPSFRRTNWHDAVGAECHAVAERVGVMDLGGFSKFVVRGAEAARWLDRLICGRLPAVGRVGLCYALTPSGHLLSEFTISRLADDRFSLLAAGSAERHDWDLLSSDLPGNGSVQLENATPGGSTLVVAGPRSRELLAKVTTADLSNAAFPWLSAREIDVAGTPVLALRINYVGELGWELHVSMERLTNVYDALFEAGAALGIHDFGVHAMDSLRLEKGYRSWKQDITHEYTPFEAGLDRFVRIDKGDFVGRAGLIAAAEKGTAQRFVSLLVDAGDADALPCAIVFGKNGQVGIVGSGGYGHRVGRSIALAYVDTSMAQIGAELTVDILGERRRALVAESPVYDASNSRLRM